MQHEFRFDIAAPREEDELTAEIWYGDFEVPYGSYHIAQIRRRGGKLQLEISQYRDKRRILEFDYEEFIATLERAKARLLHISGPL